MRFLNEKVRVVLQAHINKKNNLLKNIEIKRYNYMRMWYSILAYGSITRH